MKARPHRAYRLGELAIALLLAATIAGLLLGRYDGYRDHAEQVALRHMLAALDMALQTEAARRDGGRMALVDGNPMTWLDTPPVNYLGEAEPHALAAVPPGNWVFDRRDKTLVYVSFSSENFTFSASRLLKFKVKSLRSGADPGSPQRQGTGVGLVIERVGGASQHQ